MVSGIRGSIPPSLLAMAVSILFLCGKTSANLSIREFLEKSDPIHKRMLSYAEKRTGTCPPWKPFQCPGGDCIPIVNLCDGKRDCSDGYDENELMCTAVQRPPVEDTEGFLKALLNSYGEDFFKKIFGEKAGNGLESLGGVHKVAVALSDSPTAEFFAVQLGISATDLKRMKEVIGAISAGDTSEFGITESEASDLHFLVEKLVETGFIR